MARRESKNISTAVDPIEGQSQAMKRVIQILELREQEFVFSRSFSSMMI